MIDQLRRYVPVLDWGRTYSRTAFSNDMIAALIVTIMLIPQSLAYALLAGLPPIRQSGMLCKSLQQPRVLPCRHRRYRSVPIMGL